MKMNMHARRFIVFAILGVMGLAGSILAQPDPGNAPKGNNPANRNQANGARRNQAGDRRGGLVDRQVERQARAQERRLENVARLMNNYGFTDKKIHEALVSFHNDVDKARLAVTQAQLKLRVALRNQAITETQLGTLVNEYKIAQEDYQERRRQAEIKLDQQIGYSKKPRLQAVLILSGVLSPVDGQMNGR